VQRGGLRNTSGREGGDAYWGWNGDTGGDADGEDGDHLTGLIRLPPVCRPRDLTLQSHIRRQLYSSLALQLSASPLPLTSSHTPLAIPPFCELTTTGYTAEILQSAQALSDHAARTGPQAGKIEKEDVELAIQMRRRYEFVEAPPRDVSTCRAVGQRSVGRKAWGKDLVDVGEASGAADDV